MFFKKSFVIFT